MNYQEEEDEQEEGEEDKDEEDEKEEDEVEDDEEDEQEEETVEEEKQQDEEQKCESDEEMEGEGDPGEEYQTWNGEKVKIEYSGTKLKALRGNMKIEFPEKTQIVRIFTSSTFTGLFRLKHIVTHVLVSVVKTDSNSSLQLQLVPRPVVEELCMMSTKLFALNGIFIINISETRFY